MMQQLDAAPPSPEAPALAPATGPSIVDRMMEQRDAAPPAAPVEPEKPGIPYGSPLSAPVVKGFVERGKETLLGFTHLATRAGEFFHYAFNPSEYPGFGKLDPVEAAKSAGRGVVGAVSDPVGSGKALMDLVLGKEVGPLLRGDPEPFKENPGGALFDLMFQAPVVGMPGAAAAAGVGSAARRTIPGAERLLSKTDPLVAKLVPKYQWSDEALRLEAARSGEHYAASALQTEPAVREALDVLKADPSTAPFLAPALEYAKRDANRFRREYLLAAAPPGMTKRQTAAYLKQHTQAGTNPAGPYTPFSFKGRNLELTVDAGGNIEYGRAAQFHALPPDTQKRIMDIRGLVDENHAELVRRGILDPKTGQQHMWSYLHRMYKAHLDPGWGKKVMNPASPEYRIAAGWVQRNLPGADVHGTLKEIIGEADKIKAYPDKLFTLGGFSGPIGPKIKRVELPPEIERFLGPLGGEQQAVRLGATLDAQFRLIANDNALGRMLLAQANDGRPLLAAPPARGGAPFPDFQQLAKDDLAFGKWKGHYVHPDVADIIPTLSPASTNRLVNMYIQAWKSGKTVFNPSTHLNNILGNTIFSHLVGNSPLNPANWPYYYRAMKEIFGRGGFAWDPTTLKNFPELQFATQLGGVRPSFAAQELRSLQARIPSLRLDRPWYEQMLGLFTDTKTAAQARAMYDAMDQVARYAAFLKLRAKGMQPMVAATEVNKYFPSYAVSSQAGRFLRGESMGGAGAMVGSPFASFPLETMRIYSTAAREHPFRLFAASMVPFTFTNINLGLAGLTLEDYHRLQDSMPAEQRGKLMMPLATGEGSLSWIDASNIVPGARYFQASEPLSEALGRPIPQGPLAELWGSGPAWSIFSLLHNMNFRTGQRLVDANRGDSTAEAAKLLFQLTPTPSPVQQLFERGRRYAEETPTRRFSEPQDLLGVLGGSLFPGLEPRSTEELEAMGQQERRIRHFELKKGRKSIQKNPTIPPSEKERRSESIVDQMMRQLR